ncbi:hypothetical protein EDB85DRAFT_165585 [Lactarius pseudohatsudake]|nr:hypothetical protein EDB85DRAFT_165585 [Lactarius pseudohatsudake]
MRLRLISHPPAPMMLFTISFVPTDLHPLPLNWDSQLAVLSTADLELPRSVYALDSSAWLTEILEEVTFDVVSLTVSVVFTDGHTEDWPLMDRACIDALEDVLNNLRSAIQRPKSTLPPAPLPSPIAPIFKKPAKHKKQRSLLMQLVQSLIPNSSPPQLPMVAPPPPLSPSQPSADGALDNSWVVTKELRQCARSSLLDTYRRFVVQELKSRLPSAGYTAWIAQSTLRRTEEHMASLTDSPSSTISLPLPELSSFDCQTAIVPEDLFAYDDDPDAASETVATESDGSSVHTPDSTCAFRRGMPAALALADPNVEAFAALSRRALRLREHLLRVDVARRNAAADDAAMLAVAEVRGRRRAWLNRQLRGGAYLSDLGFATPVRSSQLARHVPLNSEHLSASLSHLSIVSSRLFPVVEDVEGESDVWGPPEGATFHVPMRRHTPVRTRTRSVWDLNRPPGLDLMEDGAMEFGPPVLMVPPPGVTPAPHSAPTVVAPLPEHELDLELGAVDGSFVNGKEVEYECGEWLPGIQLESR